MPDEAELRRKQIKALRAQIQEGIASGGNAPADEVFQRIEAHLLGLEKRAVNYPQEVGSGQRLPAFRVLHTTLPAPVKDFAPAERTLHPNDDLINKWM